MSATHAHPGGPDLPAEPVDAFLKLTGIPGSSQRDGHEEEIDGIEYVSFGGAHAEGARGGRRVEWEPFLFIVRSGIHSAPLFAHLVAGTVIVSSVLSVRRTIEGETADYARLEILNATVVSYQVAAHPTDEALVDIVKLRIPSTPTWTADHS